MALRIYLRHKQMFNIAGTPIIYTGDNPATVIATAGSVPVTEWQDMTPYVANIDKLRFTFTTDRDIQGAVVTQGSFQQKKTASNTLYFETEAYQFIKDWLVDHVAAPLNAVEVKVEDPGCGEYTDFVIRAKQLSWCEGEICEYSATLQQPDEQLDCIKRTMIADNWQGWFQKQPAGGKKHPRFSYCKELRPNGQLVFQWYIATTTIAANMLMLVITIIAINPILWILGLIEDVLNSIPGVDVDWNIPDPIDPSDIFKGLAHMYLESAGCGREHPAPLIRDYIQNVCSKCGIKVDGISAPIFFAPELTIDTSSRGIIHAKNPHYNACYLTPSAKRGIRRFKNLMMPTGPTDANPNEFYIPENAPLETLDMFLDRLKALYNAEWRVRDGVLYFWRKDWYFQNTNPYLYDFTLGSEDRKKILSGICYEWNDVKYPAYCTGIYAPDPIDTCGNEAMGRMNGTVSFGNVDTNPNFQGEMNKTAQFGATKFRLDGASTDYLYDAMQVTMGGMIFAMAFSIPGTWQLIMGQVAQQAHDYVDWGLLMKDEISALPKVIIWEPGSGYTNAKAVRDKRAYVYVAGPEPYPEINWNYPEDDGTFKLFSDKHECEYQVKGHTLTMGLEQAGYYYVKDYVGVELAKRKAMAVNWPMYFEPHYQDTLWDWFHWIDDPRKNPRLHQNWSVKIALCCEDLDKLKVLGDAHAISLLEKIKLPTPYYQDGIIKEISVAYDPEAKEGRYIEIKGIV